MAPNITINLETVGTNRTIYVVIPQLVCGIAISLLMIRFLILFGTSSKFSNSFYRIVQLDMVTNLFYYWNTWFSYRFHTNKFFLPVLKALETVVEGSLSFCKNMDFWFLHMQVFSALSMSLHRYLAVCHPQFFDKLTSKAWRFWYILYGLVLVFISWLFTRTMVKPAFEVYIVDDALMGTVYLDRYPKLMVLMSVFTSVYFVLLLFFGFLVACLASRKVREISMSDRAIGKKLSKVTAWYLLVYPATLIWSILSALDAHYHFLPDYTADIRAVALGLSMDTMTFSLPFILMIHDTNVKEALFGKRANVTLVRSTT